MGEFEHDESDEERAARELHEDDRAERKAAAMSIQRYRLVHESENNGPVYHLTADACDTGEYMRFDDHEAALAALHTSEREGWRHAAELEKERKRLESEIEALRAEIRDNTDSHLGEVNRLATLTEKAEEDRDALRNAARSVLGALSNFDEFVDDSVDDLDEACDQLRALLEEQCPTC